MAPCLLALMLVGCHREWNVCRVIDRHYYPEHYNNWTSYECYMRGKNGTCSLRLPVQHHDYVAPRWTLTYQEPGSCGTHVEYVSADRYENHAPAETHEHWRATRCSQ